MKTTKHASTYAPNNHGPLELWLFRALDEEKVEMGAGLRSRFVGAYSGSLFQARARSIDGNSIIMMLVTSGAAPRALPWIHGACRVWTAVLATSLSTTSRSAGRHEVSRMCKGRSRTLT